MSTAGHIIPRRCASRDLHAVLLSVCVVGLILLPEAVTHQDASIHPLPRIPSSFSLQADPGYAVTFLHKVHLLSAVYDHQICPSLLAVCSAVFPGFSCSTGRDKVALVVEFSPSLLARFTWKQKKSSLKFLPCV